MGHGDGGEDGAERSPGGANLGSANQRALARTIPGEKQ